MVQTVVMSGFGNAQIAKAENLASIVNYYALRSGYDSHCFSKRKVERNAIRKR